MTAATLDRADREGPAPRSVTTATTAASVDKDVSVNRSVNRSSEPQPGGRSTRRQSLSAAVANPREDRAALTAGTETGRAGPPSGTRPGAARRFAALLPVRGEALGTAARAGEPTLRCPAEGGAAQGNQ
jgi:hypothetical protein